MVKLDNATQNVDNILCEDANLSMPDTVEKCGMIECPHWVTTDWSLCVESRCLSRNKAIQKRDVRCEFGNDTKSMLCDEGERPISRQECINDRCKAIWKVDAWSEVATFFYFILKFKFKGALFCFLS